MTVPELRGRLLSHFYNLRYGNGGIVPAFRAASLDRRGSRAMGLALSSAAPRPVLRFDFRIRAWL
jgi:hypothetical protein